MTSDPLWLSALLLWHSSSLGLALDLLSLPWWLLRLRSRTGLLSYLLWLVLLSLLLRWLLWRLLWGLLRLLLRDMLRWLLWSLLGLPWRLLPLWLLRWLRGLWLVERLWRGLLTGLMRWLLTLLLLIRFLLVLWVSVGVCHRLSDGWRCEWLAAICM